MSKPFRIHTILIFIVIAVSCTPSRYTAQTSTEKMKASDYIEKYKGLAISEMKRTGVPASITLAQGMIESDFGNSQLAREANNHFGIKCHDDWTGPTVRHHDDKRNECFRKYARAEDSFYDHSDFLRSTLRYKSLFDLKQTDYKGWAKGLKKAGYATNPDYAEMLIRKIDQYELYNFDSGSLRTAEKEIRPAGQKDQEVVTAAKNISVAADSQPVTIAERLPRVMENNRIQYIIVKPGETREMLEKEFQLLRWELPKYNELDADFVPEGGELLYLQPKRDRAEPGKETHVVAAGESMYSISQKYGVKVRKLLEYNRMNEGEQPQPGTKLWLRNMKPVN